MPTDQEIKLNKLKSILTMMDENISKEEFVKSFENVVNLVLKIKQELVDKNNYSLAELKRLFDELKSNFETMANAQLLGAINNLEESAVKSWKENQTAMNLVRDKLRTLRNGEDGKDGISGINGINGKDGSPDRPEEIRDKLEILKGKERLSKDAIDGLDELIKAIPERGGGMYLFGGGVSKMAMDRFILDPYIPTGTINGSNTDFVLTKAPNPAISLKVYRGGQLQSLTEDYTLSVKTITFLTAPVVGEIIKVEHRI